MKRGLNSVLTNWLNFCPEWSRFLSILLPNPNQAELPGHTHCIGKGEQQRKEQKEVKERGNIHLFLKWEGVLAFL